MCEFVIVVFEIDKKMASENIKTTVKVESVPEDELPRIDDESREDFAVRVLDVIKEGIHGSIMKNAVSHAMDVILQKEVSKLADEVMRFRKTVSDKMLADETRSFKDPVRFEKMPDGFEAGWNAWRSDSDDREELAYQAFVNEIAPRPLIE